MRVVKILFNNFANSRTRFVVSIVVMHVPTRLISGWSNLAFVLVVVLNLPFLFLFFILHMPCHELLIFIKMFFIV